MSGAPAPSSSASRPISMVRACALLLQLRLQRMGRGVGLSLAAAGAGKPLRSSSQGDLSWLWKILLISLGGMVLTALGMSQLFSSILLRGLAEGKLASAASAQLSGLCFAVLCFQLSWANRISARGARDIEWLLTLPVSLPTIYAVEVLQRAVFSIASWWLLYPLSLGLVRQQGLFWSAPLVGALLAFILSLAVSLSSIIIDHALRRLRRGVWQGVSALATVLGLGLMMTLPVRPLISAPLRHLPWLPTDALTDLIFALSGPKWALIQQISFTLAEFAAFCCLGQLALSRIFARGWRLGEGSRVAARGSGEYAPLRVPYSGVVYKDIRQLVRDKAMLYMAVVLPLLQVFLLASVIMSQRAGFLVASSRHLPLLAFSVGAMSLMSAPGALSLEGQSLWLLFTLPRSLSQVLLHKAVTWVVMSSAWVASVLVFGLFYQPLSWALLGGAAYAFSGVGLLAVAATAQGAHCVDPIAIERGERSFRGSFALGLLLVLAAVFAFGFYADAWTRCSLVLLMAAATFGVWQTAARQLPYLLDPEQKPTPSKSALPR